MARLNNLCPSKSRLSANYCQSIPNFLKGQCAVGKKPLQPPTVVKHCTARPATTSRTSSSDPHTQEEMCVCVFMTPKSQ